jgi:hypothetical protein
MKKAILTLVIIGLALTGYGQHKRDDLANFAHWVIESNASAPKVQTVKFYDKYQNLIYEETVSAKLNISKKNTQKALNQLLNVLIYKQEYAANKKLLSTALNIKK